MHCSTTGNGNCFYNACSIALIRNESLSSILRCLTSIELYLNAELYEQHPSLDSNNSHDFLKKRDNVFALAVSFKALDSSSLTDRISAIRAEAKNNSVNYEFSPFICILALSNVLQKRFECFFPVSNEGKRTANKTMFNCSVSPLKQANETDVIHIFRCAMMSMPFLFTGKFSYKMNHYVPLLSSSVLLPEAALLVSKESIEVASKPKIADSYFAHKNASKPKSVTLPMKRKQVVLESFFDSEVRKKSKISLKKEEQKPVQSLVKKPMPKLQVEPPDEHELSTLTPKHAGFQSPLNVGMVKNDIGDVYQHINSRSDSEKYDFLRNVWKPQTSYKFPVNASGRKFQHNWLEKFSWLAYSPKLDGAFCINCVMFGGERSRNAAKLDHLFKSPLQNWSVAMQRLKDHASKSRFHQTSSVRAVNFHKCMENKAKPINVQLNEAVLKRIQENREKLIPIVGAIILCGRQTFSTRGHRDDSKHYDETKNNPGNLQAILGYLATYGKNHVFNEHIKNASINATYRSKTTQEILIQICGKMIETSIVQDIKNARYFSILADEAADISNVEQMAIVIRFVDSTSRIRESFLGFYQCNEGLSGKAVSAKILETVKELGLDMNNCRGQGYDGAGNMAGKCTGAATLIQKKYSQALYVHCKSHLLNLCVASSCNLQLVRNMMGQVRVVSQFFEAHPKRSKVLKSSIVRILPQARHRRLLNVCRTRWVARIDGLGVFIELFWPIVDTLESIKNNDDGSWSTDSIRDASSLFFATISFEFIVCLVTVSGILEYTRPLTKQLQASEMDVVAAFDNITLLYTMLQRVRRDIVKEHDVWYRKAIVLADKVGTLPSQPRTTKLQKNRENTPADNPSDYYRRAVSVPFLEFCVSEMQRRFCKTNLDLLNVFSGLPSKVVSESDWEAKFSKFLEMFKSDLPEPFYLTTELKMWETMWKTSVQPLPTTLASLLPSIDQLTFPNIYTAMKIAATLPVTTCSCERSISILRRLKTYLRNTMRQSRMSALAMIHVHREIPIDIDRVINQFAAERPKRMRLIDILSEDPGDEKIDDVAV